MAKSRERIRIEQQKRNFRRRVILFVTLIVLLLVGGAWWFSVLGLFSRIQLIDQLQALNPLSTGTEVDDTDQLLLDKERVAKREIAAERRLNEVTRRERGVESLQTELETREQELLAFEEQINEREKTLNTSQQRFENRRAVIEENIRILGSMRPEEAVSILEGYDDQLLIDTLLLEEELAEQENRFSLVSVWLSQLPPERAAAIQRKSVLKYGN